MAASSSPPFRFARFALVILSIFVWFAPHPAEAGLTGSEVIVAVNGASFDSRSLANHFIALRRIPAVNVIVLNEVPDSQVISVEEFRTKILRPLLAEISLRKLANHIQCISYSADFPSAIDISADIKPIANLPQVFTAKGSINGLTYFYSTVNRSNPNYIGLTANFYARRKTEALFSNPGGKATSTAWNEIQQLRGQNKHAEASAALEKLVREHPYQFPLAYMAAAEAARANDPDRAVKLLEAAIGLGWTAGGYLAADKQFDSVRDDPGYQDLEFLMDDQLTEFQPMVGFDARTSWSANGVRIGKPNDRRMAKYAKFGERYLLSTVLGVTRGAGTTLTQAIDSLRRSASADSTHPNGGFYFCVTSDVRTTTRKWEFLSAVDSLEAMGFEAQIVSAILPRDKLHVCGVQIGTPSFDWTTSGSHFVPGALADNLTSLGGVMLAGSAQTKLTEFLKAGAAGSSGAVTEPYAIQEKFPHPQMYVHYASGATLAEAFYMNVSGPYQLLIVGDPLCKPFSNAPTQEIDGEVRYLEQDASLELEIDLSGKHYADWLDDGRKQADRVEPLAPVEVSILFDSILSSGTRARARLVKPKINVKLSGQSSGYHEITLKFFADDPLLQCNEILIPVWLGDQNAITLSFRDLTQQNGTEHPNSSEQNAVGNSIALGEKKLSVQVTALGAERVTLWHDWEQVGMAAGDEGEFNLLLKTIGLGPVRLQARAELKDGSTIRSVPQWIEIVR